MLHNLFLIGCLIIADPDGAKSAPLESRNTTIEGNEYIRLLNSATYALDRMRNNTAQAACRDRELVKGLNNQGLNGSLVRNITCEATVGIIVFPNLTQAANDLAHALDSVQYVLAHTGVRAPGCGGLDLETIYAAGINAAAIKTLICE